MAIYRVALHGTAGGQTCINVWHVSAGEGEHSNIALQWENVVKTDWLNALSDHYTLSQIVVTELATATQHTRALGGSGAQVLSDMLPPQVAAILSWRTAQVGRRYRGRTYVGGICEGDQAEGTITAGLKTRLTTVASLLSDDWPASFTGTLVIYHKDSNAVSLINSFVVRDYLYTQRRRTIGRGV